MITMGFFSPLCHVKRNAFWHQRFRNVGRGSALLLQCHVSTLSVSSVPCFSEDSALCHKENKLQQKFFTPLQLQPSLQWTGLDVYFKRCHKKEQIVFIDMRKIIEQLGLFFLLLLILCHSLESRVWKSLLDLLPAFDLVKLITEELWCSQTLLRGGRGQITEQRKRFIWSGHFSWLLRNYKYWVITGLDLKKTQIFTTASPHIDFHLYRYWHRCAVRLGTLLKSWYVFYKMCKSTRTLHHNIVLVASLLK